VFVYSMGLTQHRYGVDNVKALVNLALARGALGREKCGVIPIRGHSGVQGGGECGVDPDKLPGGFEVANEADRHRFESLWGHRIPAWRGHRTLQMLEAAHDGDIDFLYSLGGNLLETMPDRGRAVHAHDRSIDQPMLGPADRRLDQHRRSLGPWRDRQRGGRLVDEEAERAALEHDAVAALLDGDAASLGPLGARPERDRDHEQKTHQ
jgi:hypothetical protein